MVDESAFAEKLNKLIQIKQMKMNLKNLTKFE